MLILQCHMILNASTRTTTPDCQTDHMQIICTSIQTDNQASALSLGVHFQTQTRADTAGITSRQRTVNQMRPSMLQW